MSGLNPTPENKMRIYLKRRTDINTTKSVHILFAIVYVVSSIGVFIRELGR